MIESGLAVFEYWMDYTIFWFYNAVKSVFAATNYPVPVRWNCRCEKPPKWVKETHLFLLKLDCAHTKNDYTYMSAVYAVAKATKVI